MNIAIITALNERPKISQILFNCVNRLMAETDYEFTVFAACHTDEDFFLSRMFRVTTIMHDKNIASDKFNAALRIAINDRKFDAFMIMGDDDSVSTEYVESAVEYLNAGYHYVGMKHNGYCNTASGEAMIHRYEQQTHKLIGAARMISREAMLKACIKSLVKVQRDFDDGFKRLVKGDELLIERDCAQYLYRMGYVNILSSDQYCPLWKEGLKRSLDHSSEMRLVLEGFAPTSICAGKVHVTDFKSEVNIWPYSILEDKCTPSNFDDVTWFMSDVEKEYVLSLCTK